MTAAQTRDSGVQPLGKSVIRRAFARRYESPYMRHLARVAMSNARQMRDWKRLSAPELATSPLDGGDVGVGNEPESGAESDSAATVHP